MARISLKTFFPPDQEARTEHPLPMPFASFLFFNENRPPDLHHLHASYAWDTCFTRISFANYAIQIVQYNIIYMS